MYLIQQLTSDAKQKQTLILPNGQFVSFTLVFKPLQVGWFIQDLTYQDFNLKGVRVCTSPNFIYQFCNQIPFGIACFTQGDAEPMLKEDFAIGGRSTLYLLSEEEVAQLTEFYRGQTG